MLLCYTISVPCLWHGSCDIETVYVDQRSGVRFLPWHYLNGFVAGFMIGGSVDDIISI